MPTDTKLTSETRKLVEIEKGLQRRLHPTGRAFVTGSPPIKPGIMGADLPPVPHVVCASGFTFSMQASESHYCEPRDNIGPWSKVEIGYPSRLVPELRQYQQNEEATVFGWVPLALVAQIVLEEGGFA